MYRDESRIDWAANETKLPGHAKRRVAGAALQAHSLSLRATGALLLRVLEPQPRGAFGKGRACGARISSDATEALSEFASRAKSA